MFYKPINFYYSQVNLYNARLRVCWETPEADTDTYSAIIAVPKPPIKILEKNLRRILYGNKVAN